MFRPKVAWVLVVFLILAVRPCRADGPWITSDGQRFVTLQEAGDHQFAIGRGQEVDEDKGDALAGDEMFVTVLTACPNCPARERSDSSRLLQEFRSGSLADLPKQMNFRTHVFNDRDGMRFYNAGYKGPKPLVIVQEGSNVLFTAGADALADIGKLHDDILRPCLLRRKAREPEPRPTPEPTPTPQPTPVPVAAPAPVETVKADIGPIAMALGLSMFGLGALVALVVGFVSRVRATRGG